MFKAFMMVALLATSAGAAAPKAIPLASTGRWSVDYADNMCTLSHDFGTATDKITVAFRPWPMGTSTEIVLIQPGPQPDAAIRQGKASVMLGPDGKPIPANYVMYRLPKRGIRLTTISVAQDALSALGDAPSVTLSLRGEQPVAVAPVNTRAALDALVTCQDDLVRGWGLDPNERLTIGTPAKSLVDESVWFQTEDYPSSALLANKEGTVSLLWNIGVDGKVTGCRPVKKSGEQILDEAACAIMMKRGRYRPALDKTGAPMASHGARRVDWRL